MRHPDLDNPLADWDDELNIAVATDNHDVCTQCHALILPCNVIHDTEQVAHLGARNADPYCSEACLYDAAERWFEHDTTRGDRL